MEARSGKAKDTHARMPTFRRLLGFLRLGCKRCTGSSDKTILIHPGLAPDDFVEACAEVDECVPAFLILSFPASVSFCLVYAHCIFLRNVS